MQQGVHPAHMHLNDTPCLGPQFFLIAGRDSMGRFLPTITLCFTGKSAWISRMEVIKPLPFVSERVLRGYVYIEPGSKPFLTET